ncbi:MAG TPA: acyltransferase [Gemmatimonadaceae bacterium]|nr:acyltransferase [Gemmatimonadaceae bacterium]
MNNLDVLRAVAVLCVLLDHLLWRILADDWHYVEQVLGRTGVLLFFVHTALVLMRSSQGLYATADGTAGWVKAFYVRRWFRIYPLSIAVVAFIVVTALPAGTTRGMIAANVLLIQNLVGSPNLESVLWTLPIEIQMYVLLPLCFLFARRGARPAFGLFLAAVLVGIPICLTHPKQELSITPLALAIFGPCFMSGVLAYGILSSAGAQRRRFDGKWWPLILLAAVAVFSLALQPAWNSPIRGWPLPLTVGLMIPLFSDMPSSFLSKAAKVVAKYSYSIYLLHVPLLIIAFVKTAGSLAVHLAVFGVLMIVVPYLAYRFIEDPGIRIGQRIAGVISRRAPARAPDQDIGLATGAS